MVKVLHVNDSASVDEYNSNVMKGDTMVLYYSGGCGHCIAMKPEWEKFEENHSKQNGGHYCPHHGRHCPHRASCPYMRRRHGAPIRNCNPGPHNMMIARVNADYMPMVHGHKDIMGYPTIYHLKNGKKVSEFTGPRSLEHFEKFLESIKQKSRSHKKTSKRKTKSKSKSKSKSNSKKMSGGKRRTYRKNRTRSTRHMKRR